MDRKYLSLFIIVLILTPFLSFATEIPYAQDDRDRMIRVEEGLKAVNQRIDGLERSVNQRFDTIQIFMLWGFGILFGGMGILIGFVIWDRRTALSPVVRKNKEVEEKEELLEKALKEYAKGEPKLLEVLKSLGLL